MSLFEQTPLAPPDPILGLTAAYLADVRAEKVNLGVGYYKDESLRTPILRCIKAAEKIILESEPDKEYLPIEGNAALIERVGELVFGTQFWNEERGRIAGFHTIGGTGALKIAGMFCKEQIDKPLYLSMPTWANHRGVFAGCGIAVHHYPYYDKEKHTLEIDKMLSFLRTLEPKSLILLHASCHNPTGCDPTLQEWEAIADVMIERGLIPFFDFAYQGLGQGIAEDREAVHLFAQKGCEMIVAYSVAKNFSVYGERVGALFILTENGKIAERVTSRMKQLIRITYSNPPRHGATLVAHILSDKELRVLWEEEVGAMQRRIASLRKELTERLIAKGGARSFHHLLKSQGMFCFLGLTESEVECLMTEHAIYMVRDSRINLCGLNAKNINYVVDAIFSLFSWGS